MHKEDNSITRLNADLDLAFSKKVANKFIVYNMLAAIFEKYGVRFPITDLYEDQYTFEIGDSGYYLFLLKKMDFSGHLDVYAQVVDSEELEELEDADLDISTDPINLGYTTSKYLRQTRRTDDDSGNSDEY
jgi:hypothetical protein